ncbi:MAG: methyltransferase domain-containing protein [Acidobacteria bacterium]|nr:MAG: methyltransferase domain-containing protein [Acidobacteriota bacterium]REK01757.1 MAG: methyltransferase domain-containing protein [Acidobacteriota bacterium]REK14713.1 MAG: methyltransferase domain-containing protein [Acidobacteriota bacterium]REK45428.1 MAG: methyltransferase domain-containing protein [Acidobacteriota bacterium]
MSFKSTISEQALNLTVFLGGGLVMVYEIVGSRVLSPYVGTSTYTWTSLIGIILGALSIGYWIAGRLADRRPSQRVLAAALFASGLLVCGTVIADDVVLSAIASTPLPLEIKTVVSSLILFAPAAALMGFIVPYAVKLKTRSLDETGATVGRLYALSTVGSIAGTFAAGFVLIPFVGSTRTLYGVAAILFVLGLLLFPSAAPRQKAMAATLLLAAVVINETAGMMLAGTLGVYETDTRYSKVKIVDTVKRANGRKIRAMSIDPYIYQSSMYLDDGEPASSYHRYYHLINAFKPDFSNVLMIGGAGYSFPKQYLKRYPGKKIDVVEIDPGMTSLARKYFRLKDEAAMTIIHEDGRVFLNEAPSKSYDAVLIDAFSTMFSIPQQLTTIEAVREISRVLKPHGVVILNIGTAIKGDAAMFLGAEIATYEAVFNEVRVYKVDDSKADENVQNVILAAFKGSVPEAEGRDDESKEMLATEFPSASVRRFPVLTDDLAPVEYYSSFAQSRFVKELR